MEKDVRLLQQGDDDEQKRGRDVVEGRDRRVGVARGEHLKQG